MNTLNNTFGIAFYLKKQKATQSGKCPVYARITVNSKRIEISVKRSVEENNWNAGKGMARGNKQEIVRLNEYLQKYRAGVVDCYQELMLQKKMITAELLKEKFTGSDQSEFTLCKLMDYHNTAQRTVLVDDVDGGADSNFFKDKCCVITGNFLHFDRNELPQKIKDLGGRVSSAISGSTNYLIMGTEPGWSKVEKVEKMIAEGKTMVIMDEAELVQVFDKLNSIS